MCAFVLKKTFSQLLDVSKTFNSEFAYIEVWFTHGNYKPLETEDKINIALVIT